MREERLRLAIQKSGRLSEGCFELMNSAGLKVSRGKNRLYGRICELPIDVMLVRDDDIPAFVAGNACDAGIVGDNVFEEDCLAEKRDRNAVRVMPLGFARCRLVLAVPGETVSASPDQLEGMRIATSYPALTHAWLAGQKIRADTITMKGSVEVAPQLGIADAICDIVSTGATLEANGLRPLAEVFSSQAVLIRNTQALSPARQRVFDAFVKRVRGVLASRNAKYVMMNAPRDAVAAITGYLPGAEAPTVLELAGNPDRVSIHAVCQESVFWDTLEELKKLGASSILVLPIEKMMA